MNPATSALLLSPLLFAPLTAQKDQAPQTPTEKIRIPAQPKWTKNDKAAYGTQLALYHDLYAAGWVDEINRGTMTLFSKDGDSVRRVFTRMAMERAAGDKLITRFESPAEIKGVTALTHENPGSSDNNWLYLPANKRVRRVSGANNTASFQGTEFTYEDLANLDPTEYTWRFEGEQDLERDGTKIPVFKLNAVPTYKDTGYSRIVLYIHRTHWRQERIEYFDKAGVHLKTRESKDWLQHHGHFWRQQVIEMTNHQTGKRTELRVSQVLVDLSRYKSKRTKKPRKNLSEKLFTTQAIRR